MKMVQTKGWVENKKHNLSLNITQTRDTFGTFVLEINVMFDFLSETCGTQPSSYVYRYKVD